MRRQNLEYNIRAHPQCADKESDVIGMGSRPMTSCHAIGCWNKNQLRWLYVGTSSHSANDHRRVNVPSPAKREKNGSKYEQLNNPKYLQVY